MYILELKRALKRAHFNPVATNATRLLMILNMDSTKAVKAKSRKIRRGPIPDHQTTCNMSIYIVRSWRSMIIKSIPKINTEENKDLPKHLYNYAKHTYIQKIPEPICGEPSMDKECHFIGIWLLAPTYHFQLCFVTSGFPQNI